MNKTSSDYFEKRFKTPSFWEKIREKIKIMSLSEQEVDAMKRVLINEAKPLFVASHNSNEIMDKLIVRYFDERIETLPKGALYDLYDSFIDFKNADGKEYAALARFGFITMMNLMYSLNGWFLNKTIQLIKQNTYPS
jgi:hypothetical protein